MSGSHRDTAQRPAVNARKSAFWLLGLAGLIALPLVFFGVAAFTLYMVIAEPSSPWSHPLTVAGFILVELVLVASIVWSWLERRRRS